MALRDVAEDHLVGRLAAPSGADAGDLHDGEVPSVDDPGLAVLEELAVLGQGGDPLDGVADVVGVEEVGDGLAVVGPWRCAVQPDQPERPRGSRRPAGPSWWTTTTSGETSVRRR